LQQTILSDEAMAASFSALTFDSELIGRQYQKQVVEICLTTVAGLHY
jgi:hypothetical protein